MDDTLVEIDDCEDDIYGDLETDIFLTSTKKPRSEEIYKEESYQTLLKEAEALKIKVKQLQRENKAYSSNISALYLTAKNEIDKKNFIIKNLQEKLKKVSQSKSTLTNEETEEIIRKCQEALQESQAHITLDEITKSLKNAVSSCRHEKRKLIKFGNMSMYFFKEQNSVERQESVVFPKRNETVNSNVDKTPVVLRIKEAQAPHPSHSCTTTTTTETKDSSKISTKNLKNTLPQSTRMQNDSVTAGTSYHITHELTKGKNLGRNQGEIIVSRSDSHRSSNSRRSFDNDSNEDVSRQRNYRNYHRNRKHNDDFSPPKRHRSRSNHDRDRSNSHNRDVELDSRRNTRSSKGSLRNDETFNNRRSRGGSK